MQFPPKSIIQGVTLVVALAVLGAAKAMGVTIPQAILLRADRVIE